MIPVHSVDGRKQRVSDLSSGSMSKGLPHHKFLMTSVGLTPQVTDLNNILCGISSGVVQILVSQPFEQIKVRNQSSSYLKSSYQATERRESSGTLQGYSDASLETAHLRLLPV
ncbi:hypothetical protein HG536_0H04950 [Torulaspora globosa]|uniref:Uncharacterized protein n=1 Tax=Torulaspora globosa TaxID=48254 RepID=A0A7G3ZNN3_9SACH|nr:uncharacterized protein HG536_0H04950 [Torulaspora globosa]QLL35119.1 hypothetical protein HG536_0H04950 [Torulaspora globosa]